MFHYVNRWIRQLVFIFPKNRPGQYLFYSHVENNKLFELDLFVIVLIYDSEYWVDLFSRTGNHRLFVNELPQVQ